MRYKLYWTIVVVASIHDIPVGHFDLCLVETAVLAKEMPDVLQDPEGQFGQAQDAHSGEQANYST